MAQKSQINIKENRNEQVVKKGLLRSIVEAIVNNNDNFINRSGLSSQGEILAQEQMRIMGSVSGPEGEPNTRGEVAAAEQKKIFGQGIAAANGQQFVPQTRGEVPAAEQNAIFWTDFVHRIRAD